MILVHETSLYNAASIVETGLIFSNQKGNPAEFYRIDGDPAELSLLVEESCVKSTDARFSAMGVVLVVEVADECEVINIDHTAIEVSIDVEKYENFVLNIHRAHTRESYSQTNVYRMAPWMKRLKFVGYYLRSEATMEQIALNGHGDTEFQDPNEHRDLCFVLYSRLGRFLSAPGDQESDISDLFEAKKISHSENAKRAPVGVDELHFNRHISDLG